MYTNQVSNNKIDEDNFTGSGRMLGTTSKPSMDMDEFVREILERIQNMYTPDNAVFVLQKIKLAGLNLLDNYEKHLDEQMEQICKQRSSLQKEIEVLKNNDIEPSNRKY